METHRHHRVAVGVRIWPYLPSLFVMSDRVWKTFGCVKMATESGIQGPHSRKHVNSSQWYHDALHTTVILYIYVFKRTIGAIWPVLCWRAFYDRRMSFLPSALKRHARQTWDGGLSGPILTAGILSNFRVHLLSINVFSLSLGAYFIPAPFDSSMPWLVTVILHGNCSLAECRLYKYQHQE